MAWGRPPSPRSPDLAGTVIADRLQAFTINGSAGGVVTGSIQERVIRSDDTGFLHFYHRVFFDEISGFEPGSYVEWLNLNPVATGDPLAVGRRTDGVGSATFEQLRPGQRRAEPVRFQPAQSCSGQRRLQHPISLSEDDRHQLRAHRPASAQRLRIHRLRRRSHLDRLAPDLGARGGGAGARKLGADPRGGSGFSAPSCATPGDGPRSRRPAQTGPRFSHTKAKLIGRSR